MVKGIVRYRSPPASLIRQLHEHRRWLDSGGSVGARIGFDERRLIPSPLNDLDLEGVDLSLGNLNERQFHNCNLRNSWLLDASAQGTIFVGCNLEGARFDESNMYRARILNSNTHGAVFDGANIEDAFWNEEQVQAFERVQEERAKWTEAQWGRFIAEGPDWRKEDEEQRAANLRAGRTREVIMRERLSSWRKVRCAAMNLEP